MATGVALVFEVMFDLRVNVNFKGSYFTVKYALPHLNDGASIVFTASAATKIGMEGTSVYAASKLAVETTITRAQNLWISGALKKKRFRPTPV